MGFLNGRKKKNASAGAGTRPGPASTGQEAPSTSSAAIPTKTKSKRLFGFGGGAAAAARKDSQPKKTVTKTTTTTTPPSKNTAGRNKSTPPTVSTPQSSSTTKTKRISSKITIVDGKSRGKNFSVSDVIAEERRDADIQPRNLLAELNIVATAGSTAKVGPRSNDHCDPDAFVAGSFDDEQEFGMELVLPSSVYEGDVPNVVRDDGQQQQQHRQVMSPNTTQQMAKSEDDVNVDRVADEDANQESLDISVEDYEQYLDHQRQLEARRNNQDGRQQRQHQQETPKRDDVQKITTEAIGSTDSIDARQILTVVEEKKEDDVVPKQQASDVPGMAAATAAWTTNDDSVVDFNEQDGKVSQSASIGADNEDDKNVKPSPARLNPARTAAAAAAAVASARAGLLSCAANIPTNPCQPLCGPCTDDENLNTEITVDTSGIIENDEYVFFNEQFAMKFLHAILNVGFTLVYHQAVEDEFWVGRTVTMTLRPGVCTASTLEHPCIEWMTMGGGKEQTIESVSIGLFDIDSVAMSSLRDGLDGDNNDFATDCDTDDLDCFFTLTSKDGEIHLFEALSPKESQRIVNGIRNVAARLSAMLIAGDTAVVAEFYDTVQFSGMDFDGTAVEEATQSELSKDEIMLRLSHSFLEQSPFM